MPTSPAPRARSLADDLRARSDADLVALLVARPDLARPAPADLAALAARSSTRASTQRALENLDLGHLHVLESLLASGTPADLDQARDWLGAGSGAARTTFDAHLADLVAAALVWRSGERLTVSRTAGELLGPRPGGLWPSRAAMGVSPSHPVSDGAGLAEVLSATPPTAAAVLDRLTWGSGALVRDPATEASPPVRWLTDHALLVPWGEDQLVLPREVALHLRGGRLLPDPALTPPDVARAERTAASVDATAGGAASELLAQVDEITHAWGERPPRVLRAGGLAVRDLKDLAARLDVPEERAAWLVELLLVAGLVADDGALEPSWAPTPAYDEWAAVPAAERWAALAGAWLRSTRAPHLVGSPLASVPRTDQAHPPGRTRPNATGRVNALSSEVVWPQVRGLRLDILLALAALPVGSAPSTPSLVELFAWRRPLQRVTDVATVVGAVAREAEWLGLCGQGALSAPGRALLEGDDPAFPAHAMAEHLPPAVDEVLLQADLTAVAPGRLEGPLARLLRLAADVESRGGATVYRFSEASVRRALDAGWAGEDLLASLAAASPTPVPQPLDYLVRDVTRRHGQVRVGAATSYVRSEDPVTLDTLVASPGLASLALRRIAPTVAVSPATGDIVLAALRTHGLAPAAETPDGVVSVPAGPTRRTPTRRRASTPLLTAVVDEAYARDVVTTVRSGQDAADRRAAADGETDPIVILAVLRDAAADRQPVWLDHAGRDGETTREIFHPRRVEGGRVYGTTGTSDVERSVSIHRIRATSLV